MTAAPLEGKRIVVTRRAEQAAELSTRLVALGAEAIELAMIAIVEPADGGAELRDAVRSLGDWDLVVVSSPNGARTLRSVAESLGAAEPTLPPVACVGPSTARVFDGSSFEVAVVPDRSVAEGLVDAIGTPPVDGARAVLFQAAVARETLADGLRNAGWHVDRVVAYRTVDAVIEDRDVRRLAGADAITFTSSSTVERFVRLVGLDALPPAVFTIGPITSATAVSLGVPVDGEADPHDLDGLVDVVRRWASP